MLGSHKPQPVAEHEARGDTARIYHEIRQTLRASGVNLNFRTWAGFPRFFPAMWTAMQPVAASRAFESASNDLRARAADLALTLPALRAAALLGESQRFQIERALALYHYVNPKLLLFTVLVKRGLAAGPQGAHSRHTAAPQGEHGRHTAALQGEHSRHTAGPQGAHSRHTAGPQGAHSRHTAAPQGEHGRHTAALQGEHSRHTAGPQGAHSRHTAAPQGEHSGHTAAPQGEHSRHTAAPQGEHSRHTAATQSGRQVRRRIASNDADTADPEALVPFGPPPGMAPMEMVDENPGDKRLRRLFSDIKRTLQLSSVNSDYRTLALWPDYLEPAWAALKPVVQTDAYRQAGLALGDHARSAADRFTTPTGMELHRLAAQGEKTQALMEVTDQFERLLPSLIVNLALIGRDWWPEDQLRASPFPLPEGTKLEERP